MRTAELLGGAVFKVNEWNFWLAVLWKKQAWHFSYPWIDHSALYSCFVCVDHVHIVNVWGILYAWLHNLRNVFILYKHYDQWLLPPPNTKLLCWPLIQVTWEGLHNLLLYASNDFWSNGLPTQAILPGWQLKRYHLTCACMTTGSYLLTGIPVVLYSSSNDNKKMLGVGYLWVVS